MIDNGHLDQLTKTIENYIEAKERNETVSYEYGHQYPEDVKVDAKDHLAFREMQLVTRMKYIISMIGGDNNVK